MSKRAWIEAGASLVGGAGIGAALMYLFDPETGDARRANARQSADEALATASGRLTSSLHLLSDRAQDAGQTLASTAGRWTSRAGNAMSDLGSSAGDYASDVADRASKYGRGASKAARGYARDAGRSAQGFMGIAQSHPYETAAEIAVGSIAALALGAGLMFLLDPAQGRRRRTMLRDKTVRAVRETGRYVEKTSHHLGNKAQGVAAKARHLVNDAKEATVGATDEKPTM